MILVLRSSSASGSVLTSQSLLRILSLPRSLPLCQLGTHTCSLSLFPRKQKGNISSSRKITKIRWKKGNAEISHRSFVACVSQKGRSPGEGDSFTAGSQGPGTQAHTTALLSKCLRGWVSPVPASVTLSTFIYLVPFPGRLTWLKRIHGFLAFLVPAGFCQGACRSEGR